MSVVLRCTGCSVEKRLSDQEMLARLHSRGMLKRESKPDPALMRELLGTITASIPCNECGNLGMSIHDDWSDEWTDEVLCEGCKKKIAPERLEVFPDTKLCPTCQASSEAGETPGQETEYCMRCGGLMKLARRGGSGLAGYQLVCSDCGKKG